MANYKSLNDSKWESLFEKYGILKKVKKRGVFKITSKVINEQRESRLMTKFDHEDHLPEIFKKNKLSILPISRWEYIIWHFDAYKKLKYNKNLPLINIDSRPDLESLDTKNIFSESIALNCALATGVLSTLIWGNKNAKCDLTINGRMSSQNFTFHIRDRGKDTLSELNIKNAQVEIDWGYEWEDAILIIEAKNRKCDDFLIRQLYYPYRLWRSKVTNKRIIPIFLTISNDVFSFFIYRFTDELNYNSIELIEQKNFIIGLEPITLEEVEEIINNTRIKREPEIPFPQANDFEKCINLLEILENWEKTKVEIATEYSFHRRQADYYVNAAKYLWFIEIKSDKVLLTRNGRDLIKKKRRERNKTLIKSIVSHKIFKDVLLLYITTGKRPLLKNVIDEMRGNSLYNMGRNSTYKRRASTILQRCDWIMKLTDEE